MFDTVYFNERRECLGEHDDWYVNLKKPLEAEDNDGSPQFISAKHKDTNITMSGSLEKGFTKVRVPSLASLLYGQNGQPLESSKAVAAAFDVLENLLSMVSKPVGPRSFTRVDIALNLRIEYKDIEYGLWGSALKQARKTPMIYPGESITFRRSSTELKFYDKAARTVDKDVPLAEKLPSFVRVELSLSGDDLKVALTGGVLPVVALDYMVCYRVLREHVLEVAPATQAIDVNGTDGYLAWLYRKDPSLMLPYIERGGKGKTPTRRRKNREIAKMAATIGENEIPWSDVLPENHPPEQVQLFYPNKIKRVFHPGIETHPINDVPVLSKDEKETDHQKFVRRARYRHGIGIDPSGEIKAIEVDATELGRSEIAHRGL